MFLLYYVLPVLCSFHLTLNVFIPSFLWLLLVVLGYPRLGSHLSTWYHCLPLGPLGQVISSFSLWKDWQIELCSVPAAVHILHLSHNFCTSFFIFLQLFKKGIWYLHNRGCGYSRECTFLAFVVIVSWFLLSPFCCREALLPHMKFFHAVIFKPSALWLSHGCFPHSCVYISGLQIGDFVCHLH